MYNPYNWKITKKDDVEMKMPVFPGSFVHNCVLDELGIVSNKLDAMKIERVNKEAELGKIVEEIMFLKDRKKTLLKKLYEGEDCI